MASLAALVGTDALSGDTLSCVDALFAWIETRPEWLLQLIRPNDLEGLFGSEYRALATDRKKAKHAMPILKVLLAAWMAAEPLCELERAIGTAEASIKTCETARHFAVRLAADLAFVAGLPARVMTAKALAAGEDPAIPTTLLTLSGAVRRGCASPELLANAVHLAGHSRPAAKAAFLHISRHIPPRNTFESFEETLTRVRQGHDVALFDDL